MVGMESDQDRWRQMPFVLSIHCAEVTYQFWHMRRFKGMGYDLLLLSTNYQCCQPVTVQWKWESFPRTSIVCEHVGLVQCADAPYCDSLVRGWPANWLSRYYGCIRVVVLVILYNVFNMWEKWFACMQVSPGTLAYDHGCTSSTERCDWAMILPLSRPVSSNYSITSSTNLWSV